MASCEVIPNFLPFGTVGDEFEFAVPCIARDFSFIVFTANVGVCRHDYLFVGVFGLLEQAVGPTERLLARIVFEIENDVFLVSGFEIVIGVVFGIDAAVAFDRFEIGFGEISFEF